METTKFFRNADSQDIQFYMEYDSEISFFSACCLFLEKSTFITFFSKDLHSFGLFFSYIFQKNYFMPLIIPYCRVCALSDFSNFQLIGALVARLEDFGSAHLCN